MMPRPLVMLAQQISAVVVAVGRAHDDVNMIFVMLFVFGIGLAGLMIELDQQHRAMDAVIETLSSSTPPTLLMGGLSAAASGEKFNVLDFTVLSERKWESKAERRVDR